MLRLALNPIPNAQLLISCLVLGLITSSAGAEEPQWRWWKGNLHTHSLWSDGDDFPEMIADWYREQGYNFLSLSDHNTLSEGMRWMPVKKVIARSDDSVLEQYRERFGNAWVETKGDPENDDYAVRLKPVNEFRSLLERCDEFIMIQGEEISDRAQGKPVHMNATNLAAEIQPVGGATVREAMQNNLRLVLEHQRSHGREVLPHLNHPNFGYAVTAEDLAAVVEEQFFEVYNGHPGINHLGDEDHPSIERMWDLVNAIRRSDVNVPPIMGIATDDSHEYHGRPGSRPGRGWVMVRSRYLTPEHLIKAMKRGDFYASSGVSLSEVRFDSKTRTLQIQIAIEKDVTYRTDFIATLAPTKTNETEIEMLERIGKVVATVDGTEASYQLQGNELYVRAVVTSSKAAVDPSFKDQKQQAWTQPVGWSKAQPKSTKD